MSKTTTTKATTTTAPAWGTAKTHGLTDGQQITYYDGDRKGPVGEGMVLTVRANGRMGYLLDAPNAKRSLRIAPATRFWVAPAPAAKATTKAAASKPAKAPAKGSKATAKAPAKAAASKPATKATKAPAKASSVAKPVGGVQHPGTTWLALLEAAGLSQTKAATEMGVAPMTLNRLCNGHGIPTAKVTVAFARVVGKPAADVWAGVCAYELALALADAK